MSNNFKDSIKNNLVTSKENAKEVVETDRKDTTTNKFKLSKKVEDKTAKKVFNVYMEDDLLKKVDTLSKRAGYSRNELINIMVQWCTDNLEFEK